MRSGADVDAELAEAKSGRVKGTLKTELIESLKAELSVKPDEVAPSNGTEAPPPSDEMRLAFATATMTGLIGKFGSSSRPMQSAISSADDLFDVFTGLMQGGDYKIMRVQIEEKSKLVSKLQRENAQLKVDLRHREEQVSEYMGRLQMAKLPV